ncbi:hypothetical protein PM082_024608 [Marasmius tenuissimus]|nr:hypothetical protein PM082_024608 [Marasmius tenuissimus]
MSLPPVVLGLLSTCLSSSLISLRLQVTSSRTLFMGLQAVRHHFKEIIHNKPQQTSKLYKYLPLTHFDQFRCHTSESRQSPPPENSLDGHIVTGGKGVIQTV